VPFNMPARPAPIPLASLPSLTSLYASKSLLPPTSIPAKLQPSKEFNDRVHLWQGDITKLEVTAIVNAANKSLLGGGGVDGAIHSAAGPSLKSYCRTLNGVETGQAKISPGFGLPSSFVIHTAGPIYESYENKGECKTLLEGCYKSALKCAVDDDEKSGKDGGEGVESIAFCGISTGIYGYPIEPATHVALGTVRDFLENDPNQSKVRHIIFTCFPDRDMRCYEKLLPVYFPPVETEEVQPLEAP